MMIALQQPDLVLPGPLTNVEFMLYLVGWLVWIPTYVVAIRWFFFRSRPQCIIPTVGVCGNVAFEGYWYFAGDYTHFPLMRWIYLGAFLLDLPILFGCLKYGTFGATRFIKSGNFTVGTGTRERLQHHLVIVGVLILWIGLYVSLRYSHEVPLGSIGAYTDNAVISMLFVWQQWLSPWTPMSKWTAWSKFFGTFFVTIYVALHYRGAEYALLYFLAAVSAMFDIAYVWLAHHPREVRPQAWSFDPGEYAS